MRRRWRGLPAMVTLRGPGDRDAELLGKPLTQGVHHAAATWATRFPLCNSNSSTALRLYPVVRHKIADCPSLSSHQVKT